MTHFGQKHILNESNVSVMYHILFLNLTFVLGPEHSRDAIAVFVACIFWALWLKGSFIFKTKSNVCAKQKHS